MLTRPISLALSLSAFSLAAGLLAPVSPARAESPFDRIKVEAGEALFKQECRRCHAPDADHATYGPPLNGVIKRKAGTVDGYGYSKALAGSGIVWTDAALRAWMEDNDGFLPGTKMRHVGIEDRTVQDFILAYLHSISDVK